MTPQQNGMAERRNKTLIEAARTMLADSKLPTTFWAEAVIAAGTISNESADTSYFDSPSKDVGNGEPKSVADDQKQVEDSPHNESDEKDNPEVNTSRFKLNTFNLSANTASLYDPDSPKVPTTPNTRIHKDHPIKNVIGDVKSSIQIRRMTKSTSKQGFLSAVYEEKTHDTLNTCLYACFLSQIKPISIAKALFDSSWVEATQEELL
ncbi:putative ribonuclease H-like domain-containing protein [Tanacetum coccineum]